MKSKEKKEKRFPPRLLCQFVECGYVGGWAYGFTEYHFYLGDGNPKDGAELERDVLVFKAGWN